jgi:L-2-amino-thiazoline-4-carboxylic acid hydrolase
MSKINNLPKNKSPLIKAIRELFEHRALWLYFLYDEATKDGINFEPLARKAINRCGLYQGNNLILKGKSDSLLSLRKNLFGFVAQKLFEMEIVESTDKTLYIDFHYCPLVNAWKKQNCADADIEKLCDIAMCGDRGIAETYGAKIDLPKTIAKGDPVCELRFRKLGADSVVIQ